MWNSVLSHAKYQQRGLVAATATVTAGFIASYTGGALSDNWTSCSEPGGIAADVPLSSWSPLSWPSSLTTAPPSANKSNITIRRRLRKQEHEFVSEQQLRKATTTTTENSSRGLSSGKLAASAAPAVTPSIVANDPSHKFEGQCLSRQLYKPKVPYPAWDYNWDGRISEETSMAGHLAGMDIAVNNTKKTRHIILVRHGQYYENTRLERNQKLTKLGRAQAIKTGRRLAIMAKGSAEFSDESLRGALPISKIRVSGMTRAKETAELIAQEMRKANVELKIEKPDPTLNEVMPAPMIPMRPETASWAEAEIDSDRERVEEAFQKYFYREVKGNNDDDDEFDDFEIVVCHGNMIRYLFCRALQIPPEAWLRLSIYNCSLTYLAIRPNGTVSARMLGDIGHLDYEESSYSNKFMGFKW